MSLPVRLGIGMISIYGAGSTQDIICNNPDLRFGIVNAMYNDYGVVSVGDSVMYNFNDVEKTTYVDTPFYLLPEDKVISVEDAIIPPP